MKAPEATDGHIKGINILHVLAEYLFKTKFELKESILMNQIHIKSATEIEIINCLDASFPHFFAIPGIEQRLGTWHRAEAGELACCELLLLCHQNGSFHAGF